MSESDQLQTADNEGASTNSECAVSSSKGETSNAWKVVEQNEEIIMSRKWKKPSETMALVNHFINEGMTPREVLAHMLPQYSIPDSMTDEFAVQMIFEMFSDRRTRNKIPKFNTFQQAVDLFRTKKNILVLTGAGVSVSCGIPDFRSANGIYARLHKDFPELPDPQAMFDIDFFRKNPSPFFNFAKEIFPGQFKPSVSHMFIKFLEENGQLLRNYTQNIDTLEQIAGINNVIECHGSFARSTCLNCSYEVDSEEIKADVFAQRVAYCKRCKSGVMKPNIVFFGEDLGAKFHDGMADDHDKVDLLVVIGSSLKVQPVALIPYNIEPDVPQILINREQLTRYDADIKLLGNCDDIILSLCLAIGGTIRKKMLKELEARSQIFPEFLEKYRAAVDSDIMPRMLSIDGFKQFITRRPVTKIDEVYEADDYPPVKRSRVNVGSEIETSLNNGNSVNKADNETNSSFVLGSSVAIISSVASSFSSPTSTICVDSTTISSETVISAIETTSENVMPTAKVLSTNSVADSDEVLWESNYVDVSTVLPFNTALFIPSNLNVFKGAELFYDRDSDAFCRRPGPVVARFLDDETCGEPSSSQHWSGYSSDSSVGENSDSDDDDTSQSDSAFSKTNSVPASMKYIIRSMSRTSSSGVIDREDKKDTFHFDDFVGLDEAWTGRANSCPVDFTRFPAVTLEDCEAILNDTQGADAEIEHKNRSSSVVTADFECEE